ncbi:unnamed protein product [Ectocarpus fasciculatus]
MTALVFMLQGIVAWGVITYSIDGNSTADEDLSSGITTSMNGEFPWSSISSTLIAIFLSAWTGRDTVLDILACTYIAVPFPAFVEAVGFTLLVLLHARFYGLVERCLSTAVNVAKTRRCVDHAQATHYKARARGLKKQLLLSSLKLQCNNLQGSNKATQVDFTHYIWCAERQIDGLSARNAQLETNLACLEVDFDMCHRMHDKLQTHLLCMIRDGETTLGKKDAEIRSLTKDNVTLRSANDAKDREIERLKALLVHSKEGQRTFDSAQNIADRSTEPPSPSFGRWGSADSASIFPASNSSAAPQTLVGKKAANASAAIIAAAAAGTFAYSKASRRATDKAATNIIATSTVSEADRAAAEAMIADAGLEAWGLTMRAATSAG